VNPDQQRIAAICQHSPGRLRYGVRQEKDAENQTQLRLRQSEIASNPGARHRDANPIGVAKHIDSHRQPYDRIAD
jgi:hypothetical protein